VTVPKPPVFDAQAWTDRLTEAIPKRPDGTSITIWRQLPNFVKWVRGQRDVVASHDVQLKDLKKDIDKSTTKNAQQDQRLAALEAQPTNTPFPG
jgi:hypothetical protein